MNPPTPTELAGVAAVHAGVAARVLNRLTDTPADVVCGLNALVSIAASLAAVATTTTGQQARPR